MRPWFPQLQFLAVIAGLTLASGICGAAPQEGRVPRLQPSASRASQTVSPAPALRPAQAAGGMRAVNRRANNQVPARIPQVRRYPGMRTVIPPGFVRCNSLPNASYWHSRDLLAELQWLSRKGVIPVSPIGASVDALTDYAQYPAGWRAYGISVPVGGTVQVEVQHAKLGWFRLMMVNRWGEPGEGMLHQLVEHQPVMLTYRNPGKEATAVYVIVDDPGWWSTEKEPYTLLVRRDWDPARHDLSQVKMVAGLWGASPSVSAQFRGPSLAGPAVSSH